MKKQFALITFLLVAMLGMTGCGKEDLGDTYIEGSDYQYMFEGSNIFFQQKARGNNGYFFLQGHYIYYLDDNTQKLVPLCNKADCLHNKETDENRYDECNAYVNNSVYNGHVGITYCNGYLYYLETKYSVDGDYVTLSRMKEDGSQKQSIYQWEKWTIEQWCIHRDTFYFVEHTYESVDNTQENKETIEKYAVKKLALTGVGKKQPETIYEVQEGLTVYSMGKVKAYGNHVYFMLHAVTLSDTSIITDDNYLDYTYFKYMAYDINTGKCEVLELPEEKKGVYLSSITFWKGKLILSEYDHNQELDGISNSYTANLDGSNVEVFQKEKVQGEVYISDGKYLYISNSPLVVRGYEEEEYYHVYDQEMNLIDTMKMPFEGDPEVGMEEGAYIFWLNDDNTGVELDFFDKSKIGTYQGSSIKDSYVKIAEIKFSPEDLAEVQDMQESE